MTAAERFAVEAEERGWSRAEQAFDDLKAALPHKNADGVHAASRHLLMALEHLQVAHGARLVLKAMETEVVS